MGVIGAAMEEGDITTEQNPNKSASASGRRRTSKEVSEILEILFIKIHA